jgi:hypothetical protein
MHIHPSIHPSSSLPPLHPPSHPPHRSLFVTCLPSYATD